jgi:SAM-dependent MidA family methyltransferase
VTGRAELPDLPAPSSLMSSRWSRDNLITCHPARLYCGEIQVRIDADDLARLIEGLAAQRGPIQLGAARMGVFTWDVACTGADGPFVLQVPVVIDEPGYRGRARGEVPRRNVETMRHFLARGLGRFVAAPLELVDLPGGVPAAILGALPTHRPMTFGRGAVQVELAEGELSWLISLGPGPTAELLAELVAVLAYHYDRDAGGGTALVDLAINDGDFVVRRRGDGGFDVRLTAARRLEAGIGPSLLLLYLVQMLAYEDWNVDPDGGLVGLPTLVSNPSIVFAGMVRGRRYRARDLGQPEEPAIREATGWIRDFGRSREGRGYRPFVERFLAGRLPLAFGDDPRQRWWHMVTLQTRLGVRELEARRNPEAAASARALKTFVDRLGRELERPRDDDATPATLRLNELGRGELIALLAEAGVAEGEAVADEILTRWPYRSLDHLVATVPAARPLRRFRSRLSFGRVVPDDEQGTLASLPPPADAAEGARGPRPLANPEIYGALSLPAGLEAEAARTFPTFEAYMDAALHDEGWGYYGYAVTIGRAGHFNTNPESLSPRYGRWMATSAFRCWREMVERGELAETDPFPIVEFGAGNGRLARDILDAIAGAADDAGRRFAARVQYRIYETSASLRDRQRALLGPAAIVGPGDARRPAETLARDFPEGLKGFVVTNEVPDAFGVHKVVLLPDGDALAALVVPRLEPALAALASQLAGAAMAPRLAETNAAVRRTFGFAGHPDDLYLDGPTWFAVMDALAGEPLARREALLDGLWFEEAYVPVSHLPALAAHLAAGADQYATALAAADDGVVVYVNVHAGRFIRQLGGALAAGLIVTVDYGDTTWTLIQGARRGHFPFRVYGDWQDYVPRANDPYTAPGTQDLTADVNFTDLARAGSDVGLEVVHYSHERDVTGDDLANLLDAAADDDALAEFIGNPMFKLLALGRRPSAIFTGPLTSPAELFCRAQSLPTARRPRAAAIERLLSAP